MICRSGGIGRRARFKIECPKGVRVRVSPSVPEKNMNEIQIITAQSSSFLGPQLILIGGFFLFIYFLIIRPQNKRMKAQREMIENLSVGDEIVASGGLVGSILKISDNFLTIRANNSELIIQRSSVSSVLPKGTIKSL